MKNKILAIASFLGLLAVVLGAFGAHALKEKLSVDALSSFQTAVRYQMFHVLLILVVNIITLLSEKQKNSISYFLFAGIFCFSGSIYAIHLGNIPAKSIWFVTPLGGLLFIIAWSLLAFAFLKGQKSNEQ